MPPESYRSTIQNLAIVNCFQYIFVSHIHMVRISALLVKGMINQEKALPLLPPDSP